MHGHLGATDRHYRSATASCPQLRRMEGRGGRSPVRVPDVGVTRWRRYGKDRLYVKDADGRDLHRDGVQDAARRRRQPRPRRQQPDDTIGAGLARGVVAQLRAEIPGTGVRIVQ